MSSNKPIVFWIDLFSGAGGTTTGIHLSRANAKVVACVNHDAKAIESHRINHPLCVHFIEDIRDFKVVVKLKYMVEALRKHYPGCIINIWASLECTNYSKAKGGLPRDADSRTLANHLFMYLDELKPDGLWIENVREFMAWGPLCENGKPISRYNGVDYVKWCNNVIKRGFSYDYKLLNSADFGAYTSRERYFGQFVRKGIPIAWPKPTHAKKLPEDTGLFKSAKKKWRAVKDVLDLKDEGKSIFERKKQLSENTEKRIYAGLIKFVAGGEKEFIKRYNGGDPKNKVKSLQSPLGTISTNNRHAIVKTVFLTSYYGNGHVHSIDNPSPTLTTKDRLASIQPQFFTNYYSNGGETTSINQPSPTILAIPKQRLTSCNFIDNQYGNSLPQGIHQPTGTITGNPKQALVTTKPWIMDTNFNNVGTSIHNPLGTIVAARKHHYLLNPQFTSKGSSIEQPCPTIIARQDKKPLYMVSCKQSENFGIIVYESDSPTMIKIKEFMAMYGIIDIKMRMLKVSELLRIQGFPNGYKLTGTQTDQKKFIGNSVVPLMAQKLVESNYEAISSAA